MGQRGREIKRRGRKRERREKGRGGWEDERKSNED